MSRWPSWAPVPNKPTVSVDVKQHSNKKLWRHFGHLQACLLTAGPWSPTRLELWETGGVYVYTAQITAC